jgi:hypothetical protein
MPANVLPPMAYQNTGSVYGMMAPAQTLMVSNIVVFVFGSRGINLRSPVALRAVLHRRFQV